MLGGDSQKKAEALKQLHKTYFEASRREAKRKIKENIEEMEWELIEATLQEQDKTASLKKIEQYRRSNVRPFFLWKFHFAEVFQENGGFDVVIANPPYVRQESIRDIKPQLAKEYGDFYCGMADIYTYFYRRGVDLLKNCGHLCFIAPNKFMRAGYGKNTRKFLTTKVVPKSIIDFGDLPIFDATTYPSIILLEKRKPQGQDKIKVANFTDELQLDRIEKTLLDIAFPMPLSALREEGWNLERPEILALMEKLRRAGKPLGEYVQGRFYRGILTGLNEAFVIDEATRARLIAEDSASVELIKPWLRGRDIKKWKSEWSGLYIIFSRRGVDIEQYPAIKKHLSQFRNDLEPKKTDGQKQGRKPGSYKWYEIQDNIAYFEEFECPKIILGRFMNKAMFTFDKDAFLHNDALYMIAGVDEYVVAILNSSLSWWFLKNICTDLQNGYLQAFKENLFQIPISYATTTQKAPTIERVQKIIAAPDSPDVPRLEAEIDQMVYKLYDLTTEEIALIEAITS